MIVTATDYNGPEGTKTWCPYCDKARANIKNVLIPQCTERLIYCTVTKEEWVGNKTHPYKADARLLVRGVPTALLLRRSGDTWEVLHRVEKDSDF